MWAILLRASPRFGSRTHDDLMAGELVGYFGPDTTDEQIADAIITNYERITGKTVKPDEPEPRTSPEPRTCR